MTTNLQLANRALAHIGQMAITDLADTEDKAARTCNEFLQSVIDEVLREHRWSCATDRTTLSRLSDAPSHGFAYAYQLPPDFLRLLEVNGEQFTESDQYHEIEVDGRLLSNSDEAKVRYVKRITVDKFDPLLAKAVAAALAAEICIPLSVDVRMRSQCESLAARAISKAKFVNAIEVGSREGNTLARLIASSPLVRARRGRVRNPLRYDLP